MRRSGIRKYFGPMFIIIGLGIFAIVLHILNTQTSSFTGNWGFIVNRYINAMPYLILIFIAIYWFIRRGR